MKLSAVIGMNFGDEGKGHITNYLASSTSLVARFNGGAQAGHRVVLDNGTEHVFSHFGSGTLKGASTLLCSRFIVNPIMFMKELDVLKDKINTFPKVFIDPRCIVTTPYDMLINVYNSKRLSAKDTIGVGINETVERSENASYRLTVEDILTKPESYLKTFLYDVEATWVPLRAEALEFDLGAFKAFAKDRGDPSVWESMFLSSIDWIRKHTMVFKDHEVITAYSKKYASTGHIVFEGAQGMLLDQNRTEYYPYLTRSNTSVLNVLEALRGVAKEDLYEKLNIYLTTRTYLTRHGDGPLPNAGLGHPWPERNKEDPNNAENEHQGKMRYALLSKEWIEDAFDETIGYTEQESLMPKCVRSARIDFAVTHMDVIPTLETSKALSTKVRIVSQDEREPYEESLYGIFLGYVAFISSGPKESNITKV